MSTLKTVLNAEIFAAIPAMNAASRPVIATPVRPVGNRLRMRNSTESLYWTKLPDAPPATFSPAFMRAISGTRTAASMPGKTVRKGTSIFGKAPIIGVLRADDRESDAIARCTSTKFVVQ